jgi:hypothetical protein
MFMLACSEGGAAIERALRELDRSYFATLYRGGMRCESPTPMGFNCHFDVQVASANIGASMYNNVPMAYFYVD